MAQVFIPDFHIVANRNGSAAGGDFAIADAQLQGFTSWLYACDFERRTTDGERRFDRRSISEFMQVTGAQRRAG